MNFTHSPDTIFSRIYVLINGLWCDCDSVSLFDCTVENKNQWNKIASRIWYDTEHCFENLVHDIAVISYIKSSLLYMLNECLEQA